MSVIGISSSACFYPEEDDPQNFDGSTITWTFEVPKEVRTGPGLYRIELIRNLTADERKAKSATLLAEARGESTPSGDTQPIGGDAQ